MRKLIKRAGYIAAFAGLAYGWVLGLYLAHKPFIKYERPEQSDLIFTLNRDMLRRQDYVYLLGVLQKREAFDNKILKQYRDYFQRVYQYSPDRVYAVTLAGFCDYYLGNIQEAKAAYEKAIELRPFFFWYYYNLGVIYFNEDNLKGAALMWSKALALDPTPTLKLILSRPRSYLAKAYAQGHESPKEIAKEIRSGYLQLMSRLTQLKQNEHLNEELPLQLKLF